MTLATALAAPVEEGMMLPDAERVVDCLHHRSQAVRGARRTGDCCHRGLVGV